MSGRCFGHYLLVLEELVDADAVDALGVRTDVLLNLAALAGETGRTLAPEVVDEVGAVGSKQAGLLGTVVDVDVAEDALPAGGAVADEAALILETKEI